MNHSLFVKAISQPRFARYFAASGDEIDKAWELYRANIALSQQVYAIIGILEVTIRNSIDRYLTETHGAEWLAEAVSENGFLNNTAGCEESFHYVQDSIQKLGGEYSHDKLIAQLSFGFWKYFFSKHEYTAAGNSLVKIFPNRPFGTNQKLIYHNLTKIVLLRNRIAHLEPICFENKTSNISTKLVKKRYTLMLEMMRWLGFDPNELLHEIDHVNEAIQAIENLKNDKINRLINYILAHPVQSYEGFPEYF
jgi:hypothetical protein